MGCKETKGNKEGGTMNIRRHPFIPFVSWKGQTGVRRDVAYEVAMLWLLAVVFGLLSFIFSIVVEIAPSIQPLSDTATKLFLVSGSFMVGTMWGMLTAMQLFAQIAKQQGLKLQVVKTRPSHWLDMVELVPQMPVETGKTGNDSPVVLTNAEQETIAGNRVIWRYKFPLAASASGGVIVAQALMMTSLSCKIQGVILISLIFVWLAVVNKLKNNERKVIASKDYEQQLGD
jgi:hypothetical protein